MGLSTPASNNTIVTVNVSDPAVLSLSTATQQGAANVEVQAGSTTSPGIRAFAEKAGVVMITATATAFPPAFIVQAIGAVPEMLFSPGTSSVAAALTATIPLVFVPVPLNYLTVSLLSSNTAAATVATPLVVSARASSGLVSITGVAPGSSVITATAPGYGSASLIVNVTPAGGPAILLPQNLILNSGDEVVMTVALSAPATDATIVSLTSSNAAIFSLSTTATQANSANVLIQKGQTSATIRVVAGSPGTVTLTGTATGYPTAMTPVMVVTPSSPGN